MFEKIKVEVEKLAMVPYDKLRPFQGNLKDLTDKAYEKLKHEIIERGFSFAIHVWEYKGKLHILDGHQRLRCVEEMQKEGYQIPPLPCVWVKAKNLKEAKLKVLSGASQYGDVNRDGLYNFMEDSGIVFDDIKDGMKFQEFTLQGFNAEFYIDLAGKAGEKPESTKVTKEVTFNAFKCPHCSHVFYDHEKIPVPTDERPTVIRRKKG